MNDKKMIRILFLIPTLGHGGAEKVLVNLVNCIDKKNFDITVMTLYDEGINKEFLSTDVKYLSWMKKSFKGVGHLLKLISPNYLYNIVIKEKYDIVVSFLEGQTARIISGCQSPNTKKICWIHRTYTDINDLSGMFRNTKEALKCYNNFDGIVSVSKDVEKHFFSLLPIKYKGIVLYNTNRTDLIHKDMKEDVENKIFDSQVYKLCAMGSLIPVKGFKRLINVHERLIKEGIPVKTFIIGEGPEERELKVLINRKGLENSVILLGYQKNPYKYISKCDVFVCSSYSEGFSTAATEALICGIPVVTTLVSGMKELLGESKCGVISNNNEDDLFSTLINFLSEENIQIAKDAAVKRSEMFLMKNTVQAVENYFRRLVSE